jgi:chromosome segregation ATPase
MSKVYESLKDVVPVTSSSFSRIKGTNALPLKDQMEQLEKFAADLEKQTNQLHQAIQRTKEEAASEAKQVEHLAETFKAQIAALEAQLTKTEETIRGKDSIIKALEENLAGKIQESESQEKLLADREKHVNDLNTQVQLLTKGIKDMSSFFRQAEALVSLETRNIDGVLDGGESKNEQDKRAASRLESPTVISNKTDTAKETVPPEFFDRVTSELTQVIGPMASVVIRDHVRAFGESIERFPQTRITELLRVLSEEIPDQNRKDGFRECLEQSPAYVR